MGGVIKRERWYTDEKYIGEILGIHVYAQRSRPSRGANSVLVEKP